MEAAFWHARWQAGQIGFHQAGANRLLQAHFAGLGLGPGARVFVPLCGRTHDIGWLRAQGCRVVGAELSPLAITRLFETLDLTPEVTPSGPLDRYSAAGIEIFVGDIMDLTGPMLGPVDAVYDRAALVALPPDMRARYAGHLHRISNRAPKLVICFDYDQSLAEGPPFSIDGAALAALHGAQYRLTLLQDADFGLLWGRIAARETIWRLDPLPLSG